LPADNVDEGIVLGQSVHPVSYFYHSISWIACTA